MSDLKWNNQKRKLSDLKNYEHNPRKLSDKQKNDLKKSLEKFDLAEIPAINTDNTIIAGHQRISILRELYDNCEIDVRVPNRQLTQHELQEYNIRSNKNTGEWDFDVLDLEFEKNDLLDWGFTKGELDFGLSDDEIKDDNFNPEEIIENQQPVTKTGDIYKLGNHRLVCGDCTNDLHLNKLMDNNIADMLFTSPPYNMEKPKYNLYNDKLDQNDWLQFIKSSLLTAQKISRYQFYNLQHLTNNKTALIEFLYYFREYYVDTVIWTKPNAKPCSTTNILTPLYEYIFIFSNDKSLDRKIKIANFGEIVYNIYDGKKINVNEFSEFHKAIFPIDFALYFIKTFTQKNMTILDVFGGTGTTLIAAEQLNRQCYMIEIDPLYCDIIVKRYCKFMDIDSESVFKSKCC